MTQNKNKAAMRYAARLTCIYDWTQGGMDREAERLSKADCIEAIRKLWPVRETDENVLRLWNIIGDEFPGVSNGSITEAEKWDIAELVRVYNMQRREIEAVDLLKRVYEKDGRDLFAIAKGCDVYCWTLKGWMDFRKHIPWKMVKSLEALEKGGTDYTIKDAFEGMKEVCGNGPERT